MSISRSKWKNWVHFAFSNFKSWRMQSALFFYFWPWSKWSKMEKVRHILLSSTLKVWENKVPSLFFIFGHLNHDMAIFETSENNWKNWTYLEIIFGFGFFKFECLHIWDFHNQSDRQIYRKGSWTLPGPLNIFIFKPESYFAAAQEIPHVQLPTTWLMEWKSEEEKTRGPVPPPS